MTPQELLQLSINLNRYNAWRRGDTEIPQPHPEELGRWIDQAADYIYMDAVLQEAEDSI